LPAAEAEALVSANYRPREVKDRPAKALPLFLEAAE